MKWMAYAVQLGSLSAFASCGHCLGYAQDREVPIPAEIRLKIRAQ